MSSGLMPPLYARTMLLDAQAGAAPVLSDVELLASSYLAALEALAEARWNPIDPNELIR